MTIAGFWIVAAMLVVLAWLMLNAPGRSHAPRPSAAGVDGANVRVLKEHLAALNAELALGRIDLAEHRTARAEIERRLFEENPLGQDTAPSSAAGPRSRADIVKLGIAVPVIALGLYGFLGNLDGLSQPDATPALAASPAAEDVSPRAVEAMLDDMAKRMQSQKAGTTDAAGWTMLARSYAALQRFDSANDAYARAIDLAPDDAQLLVDRADVLSMLQGRSAAGEPSRLIARALVLDPNNLKGLALAGSEAFARGDFGAAVGHWNKARALAQPGSFADSMDRSLQEARTAMAAPGGQADAVAMETPTKAPAAVARINGRVNLAPALASQVQPGDTVFVFARAEQGPRMPLAIVRYKASDLPIDFTLDDSSAMSPALRLSGFERVVVGVRVSRSGNATPSAGDLRGESAAVGVRASDVAVIIDAVEPEPTRQASPPSTLGTR